MTFPEIQIPGRTPPLHEEPTPRWLVAVNWCALAGVLTLVAVTFAAQACLWISR